MARPVKDVKTISKRFKTLKEIIEASEDVLDFGDFVVGASIDEQMLTNEDYKVLEELVQSMRDAATLLNTTFKKWYDREEQKFFNQALNDADMKEMLLRLMVKEGVEIDGFVLKGSANSSNDLPHTESNDSSNDNVDSDLSSSSNSSDSASSDKVSSTDSTRVESKTVTSNLESKGGFDKRPSQQTQQSSQNSFNKPGGFL